MDERDLVFRSAIAKILRLHYVSPRGRQEKRKKGENRLAKEARTARQTKNEEARQAWRTEYGNSQLVRGRLPRLKYRQFLRF